MVVAALAKAVEHALLRVELTLPQYRMLSVLAREDSPTASRVAWELSVMPATVTAVMDGLVAGKYVRREPDPHDRRKIALVITSEGRHLLATANEEIGRRLGELTSFLDGDQAKRAMDALALWREALASERQAEWVAREDARRKESR
ncbi:MarR family winged helix-turn-helix transcriptional regulator [Actinomadura terrae]|uniref:MarR family winged helix-turn-helix transcriptional regulator n=1 Tax=Actinomadura terrae TaxID=604353 RepID=UPI001FA7F7A0|nr:MarR family transcriptional regulator [Actinomadura terrae]